MRRRSFDDNSSPQLFRIQYHKLRQIEQLGDLVHVADCTPLPIDIIEVVAAKLGTQAIEIAGSPWLVWPLRQVLLVLQVPGKALQQVQRVQGKELLQVQRVRMMTLIVVDLAPYVMILGPGRWSTSCGRWS
jgi:hypothetical protein